MVIVYCTRYPKSYSNYSSGAQIFQAQLECLAGLLEHYPCDELLGAISHVLLAKKLTRSWKPAQETILIISFGTYFHNSIQVYGHRGSFRKLLICSNRELLQATEVSLEASPRGLGG